MAPNVNFYVQFLRFLPESIKFKILSYLTKLNYGIHSDQVMKGLVCPGLRQINLASSTITNGTMRILSQCTMMDTIIFSKGRYQMTTEGIHI